VNKRGGGQSPGSYTLNALATGPPMLYQCSHSISGLIPSTVPTYMVPFGDVLAVIDATNAVAYVARDGWQTLKLL